MGKSFQCTYDTSCMYSVTNTKLMQNLCYFNMKTRFYHVIITYGRIAGNHIVDICFGFV
jgi:hypothetical protein